MEGVKYDHAEASTENVWERVSHTVCGSVSSNTWNVYHLGFTSSTERLESMFKASRSVRHGYLELFILAYVFILLTFICDESLMEIHICVAGFVKKRGIFAWSAYQACN